MAFPISSCCGRSGSHETSPPPPPPPSTLLDDLLIAWKLEEGLTPSEGTGDLVASGGTPTYDNAVPIADGYYAILPSGTKLRLGSTTLPNDFSVSMWFKDATPANVDGFFNTQEFYCYVFGGMLQVEYNSDPGGGGGGYTSLSDLIAIDGNVHHLAITADSNTGAVNVYYDGSLLATGGEWIGNQFTPPGSDFFDFGPSTNGLNVDEISMWTRPLIAGEITELQSSFYPYS